MLEIVDGYDVISLANFGVQRGDASVASDSATQQILQHNISPYFNINPTIFLIPRIS